MDGATQTAIRGFQRDNGLPQDGELSAALFAKTRTAVIKSREAERAKVSSPSAVAGSGSPSGGGSAGTVASTAGAARPGENPSCRFAKWEGEVTNLADLFACDQGRAIATLSSGRSVVFRIRSIDFANGKLRALMTQQLSVVGELSKGMQKQFTWDKWLQGTQSASQLYNFICLLDAGKASAVKQGAVIKTNAKLVSFSDDTGVLECSF